MPKYLISPSLLAADYARLGEESSQVLAAGADMLHIDVMDNHYVPNLTMGPSICQALRNFGINAPLDVHIMASPVDRLIIDFAKAGASYITIHPEATHHLDRSISLIRDHGIKAGIALNPCTPLNILDYIISKLDLVLVMLVNPGFGGQKLIPHMLPKISALRTYLEQAAHANVLVSVDGGVSLTNINALAQAGAQVFVAGSAIFQSHDYADTIRQIRHQLNPVYQ